MQKILSINMLHYPFVEFFLIKILIKMYEMYYNKRFFRKKLKKIWFLPVFSEKNSK